MFNMFHLYFFFLATFSLLNESMYTWEIRFYCALSLFMLKYLLAQNLFEISWKQMVTACYKILSTLFLPLKICLTVSVHSLSGFLL